MVLGEKLGFGRLYKQKSRHDQEKHHTVREEPKSQQSASPEVDFQLLITE